jgi:hypothetical protein
LTLPSSKFGSKPSIKEDFIKKGAWQISTLPFFLLYWRIL